MTAPDTLIARALLALAAADALTLLPKPLALSQLSDPAGPLPERFGQVSQPTQLTLAVADSLANHGRVHEGDLTARLVHCVLARRLLRPDPGLASRLTAIDAGGLADAASGTSLRQLAPALLVGLCYAHDSASVRALGGSVARLMGGSEQAEHCALALATAAGLLAHSPETTQLSKAVAAAVIDQLPDLSESLRTGSPTTPGYAALVSAFIIFDRHEGDQAGMLTETIAHPADPWGLTPVCAALAAIVAPLGPLQAVSERVHDRQRWQAADIRRVAARLTNLPPYSATSSTETAS